MTDKKLQETADAGTTATGNMATVPNRMSNKMVQRPMKVVSNQQYLDMLMKKRNKNDFTY